ncbi:MAG TPA: hypothetical protein VFN35_32805 [Ktedonobacteraceae bacterium]|nr:hypothetical protein [Ktedonobacteraceae bacterium]
MRHLLWRIHHPERQLPPHEGVQQLRAWDAETKRASVVRIGLAALGLLCHLLLFVLLFFPYVRIHNRYGPSFTFTGWNLGHDLSLTGGDPISGVLPVLVLLPVLSYLACLLTLFRKRERTNAWLEKSLYMQVVWNTLGFIVIYAFLSLQQIRDPGYWEVVRDASYDIHLAFFLLSGVCSSVSSILLGLLLRRNRINHR